MEELLPYYERELGFLRSSSREFAQRYPKIAGRLGLAGEIGEDPHVERMIEAFALLGARINKKLDDDYPEFTDALFEVLYPHYLRPFPSCSIAQFELPAGEGMSAGLARIARGTELRSAAVRGVPCRFRTAYEVALAPIRISDAHFVANARAPGTIKLPAGATGSIAITVSCGAGLESLDKLPLDTLRLYLHGEASFVAALRDCLFMRVCAAYAHAPDAPWQALGAVPLREVGLAEQDALIDFPPSSHPAYRLLAEYFAFGEKFNFVDLDLRALRGAARGAKSVTLHLPVRGVRADSNTARLLEMLNPDHLRLGCTPVVNLFKQRADPIRMTHTQTDYPVVADARRAYSYEVYSVDRVSQVRQSGPSAQQASIVEFRPFYSLHHGREATGHYWSLRRDPMLAQRSPGYEMSMTVVDEDFDPVRAQTETLSIELTCTNRDLPTQLAVGQPGGDLVIEGAATHRIRMLRRPTPSRRFEQGRGAHWRLISHLALNHLSLVDSGLPALKETLRLYDLSQSAVAARQIDGLAGLGYTPTTHWMRGEPFATFVRGVQVRLEINEDNFVGTSLHTFVSVINRFFGLYVHANSFIQLIVAARGGDELIRCEPCNGDAILV